MSTVDGGRARVRAVVGAAAVALALAGCAQPTDPGAASGPTEDAMTPPQDSPTPTAPGGPVVPAPDWAGVELAPGVVVRGLPEGVAGATDSPVGAAWAPADGLLYVVTYGSSSCPTTAEPQAADDAGTLVVTLVPPPADAICTMDYAPTTSVVGMPDGADADGPVSVRLGDAGTVEVPPRPGTGEAGQAAWVTSS
ncbi:hypothetical protein [Isoptericola variabilis]|uniref:Lipoprotein n=1 Tax=Isoptericola variabilis (strain 225) TaxID=743718 RepID=F6FU30_ISOV2|nr:hypothetical protein [Isoptericola variabilis]AEG43226.1 hypothetical protein Isova_0429 [Isoptericola variabilis 225]TWH35161.1 hypothetical protein L600_000100001650 [Isoptericola variabilis J7]